MNARRAAGVWILAAAWLVPALSLPSSAEATADRDGSTVATAPGGRAAERDEARESPPQRFTLEQLESLAAGAAAPGPAKRMAHGMGPAGLDWTFLGPRPMTGEYWSSYRDVGGRVSCVAPHPTDPAIAYLAAAQGGVWKTTDAGATWTVLTDGLPSIASGALAIDPLRPNTIWYGTGEAHYCGDCFYGDGLYRSDDAGASWAKVAPASIVGNYIARVVLMPGTHDTLYVGGNRGFLRSTDGGATWTRLLGGNWCDDIVADPRVPTNVYCSINGAGVYRSFDAGETWNQSLALTGRTNLAIAPDHPMVLYASASTPGGYLLGTYRSSNRGGTWQALAGTPDYLAGQGWYDNTIAVSPTDSATVIVGGVFPYDGARHGLMRSTDAGATWTDVTIGVDGKRVHPDQHTLAFGPDGTLWLGNDGGVWKSADLGDHWTDLNATLGAAQFYTVAAHPTNPSDLIGGTQDNGSVRFTGAAAWPVVVSGDGGPVMYLRENPAYFYTSYVRMNPLYRWYDGNGLGAITGGWTTGADRLDWANAPLVEDPLANNTFYAGSQRVWKTSTGGSAWSAISPDVTAGSGVLRSIAVSPQDGRLLWTGASDGAVSRSRDGGATWTAGARLIGAVGTLAASPADTALAYACVDAAYGSRVVRSTDGGATFASLAAGLPSGLRGMSLAVDWRTSPERLYLGTDYGVYASLDAGATWTRAGANLPNVAVYALALDAVNGKLVAATHGRGMWRADLDVSGPELALTSPAGGESWPLGSSRTITWSASDPSGVAAVDLQLSTDGGATYPVTLASGLANGGSWAWTVGPAPTALARVRAVARDGLGQSTTAASGASFWITTAAGVEGPAVAFALDPVAPNLGAGPFRVGFGLPAPARVVAGVYDATGRRVRSLAEGTFGPGRHALQWDARDDAGAAAAPGVYFVRLRAAGHDAVRRLAVLR